MLWYNKTLITKAVRIDELGNKFTTVVKNQVEVQSNLTMSRLFSRWIVKNIEAIKTLFNLDKHGPIMHDLVFFILHQLYGW